MDLGHLLSRRTVFKAGAAMAFVGPLSRVFGSPTPMQVGPKRIYLAPDDHTDYMWSGTEAQYRDAFLETTDYYLDLIDATAGNPSDHQARYNFDGSIWMWTYERNRTAAQFERLVGRLRDGHLSVPLNTLVGVYGGAPAEAVLRGMYYAGRIERRHGLPFPLAVAMENQTLPYGLGALWAGAGARYSWRGVCGCVSRTPSAGDREREIYWWIGPDGSRILMKWHSLSASVPKIEPKNLERYKAYGKLFGGKPNANEGIGGYAEARYPFEAVEFVDRDPAFLALYPYRVVGAFGQGWDNLKTTTDLFPLAAREKSDATRRVIVSNEIDFFEDFERTYGAGLPTQSVTFGNEWELASAIVQGATSTVCRAVERLRAAEAMATLVSLHDRGFMASRTEARDGAFHDLGLYWEHNMLNGGEAVSDVERRDWQRTVADRIAAYVDALHRDAALALGAQIRKGPTTTFFVFNPLGGSRTDVADLPYDGPAEVRVRDARSGKEAPAQIVTIDGVRKLRILAEGVPSVGYRTYAIVPGEPKPLAPAASVAGRLIESDRYRVTLAEDGAIESLYDKRLRREFAAQQVQPGRAQTVRLNDLGPLTSADFVSKVEVENGGPVSVTLKLSVSGAGVPLDHVSRVTLYRKVPRIEIDDAILEEFDAPTTWGFGFNLAQPDTTYEEVGAICRARLVTDGGHYAARNARYDWATLNHYVDVSGAGDMGVTLSNADCRFMRIGNSTVERLDPDTALVSPLAGGRTDKGFTLAAETGPRAYRFALLPHGPWDAARAMRFALEHQNSLVAGFATGDASAPYGEARSLLSISPSSALVWAVKPAEEGIDQGMIVRVWNLDRRAASVTIRPAPRLARAARTTHVETDQEALPLRGNAIRLPLAGQGLGTVRLVLTSG